MCLSYFFFLFLWWLRLPGYGTQIPQSRLTNVNHCDCDDDSWLHRGSYVAHERNGITISETGVGCVTQEEIKLTKRREYQREYQCEYQRECRKRKKESLLDG